MRFIKQTSPIRHFLPVKSIITALDDHIIGTASPSADIWTTYLSQGRSDRDLGWCVDEGWFLGKCCTIMRRV